MGMTTKRTENAGYAERVEQERPARDHYYKTSVEVGAAKGRAFAERQDTMDALHAEAQSGQH
jgi:hypothetical protein